jgi:hypothetical protein
MSLNDDEDEDELIEIDIYDDTGTGCDYPPEDPDH